MLDYQTGVKKGNFRSIDDVWEENPLPDPLTEGGFLKLLSDSGTVAYWDFNSSLGTIIKEKYEELSYKILEVAGAVARRINRPMIFWAAVPCSIANCLTLQDAPKITPMGGKEPFYLGIMRQKVEIYSCPLLEKSIFVGCGKEVFSNDHYGRIELHNLLI
jgi:hypothetical protein